MNAAGFSISGLTAPFTISGGGSISFAVKFAPTSTGVFSGSISFINNATNSAVQYSVVGTGTATSGGISGTPSAISFGTVATGTTNSQTVQLRNNGNSSVTISSASVSGAGFQISGLSLPTTLSASQTKSFTVAFAPTSTASVTGSITVKSNATNPTYTLALSGSGGTATRSISLSATSLNFGNEIVGKTSTLGVAVKNTGNSSVTVAQISTTGTGFSVNSGVTGSTIAPGQTAEMGVVFAPKSTGGVTGLVTIVSNATNSPGKVSVAGTGVSNTAHSVALNWGASSSSAIAGYHVYRSTTGGGSYQRLTSSLISALSYADATVTSGSTYYYVVTAVTSNGAESTYSGQAVANIP